MLEYNFSTFVSKNRFCNPCTCFHISLWAWLVFYCHITAFYLTKILHFWKFTTCHNYKEDTERKHLSRRHTCVGMSGKVIIIFLSLVLLNWQETHSKREELVMNFAVVNLGICLFFQCLNIFGNLELTLFEAAWLRQIYCLKSMHDLCIDLQWIDPPQRYTGKKIESWSSFIMGNWHF